MIAPELPSVHAGPAITGELSLTPDPIPWDAEIVAISWRVSGISHGTLWVSEGDQVERLVAGGQEGIATIGWIGLHHSYEFRLYTAEDPRQLLAALVVERESIPWERLSARLGALKFDREDKASAAEFVGDILERELVHTVDYQKHFLGWQEKGVHVTPVHHYQPIPDTRVIAERTWSKNTVSGVQLNLSGQLKLVRSRFPAYKDEYDLIPLQKEDGHGGFYLQNGRFEGLDPYAAYCLIRYFKPRRIIEIGGGYSSLLMARAALRNGSTRLETVEPYPVDFLEAGFPGLAALHKEKVESLPYSFFESLGYNDILFIDSSHVVKTGGDVTFLFLEILPRLKPGVIVHVHDINFPFDYPRNWIIDRQRFWSEQYLLQAFLTYNSEFEVLFSSTAMILSHPGAIRAAFPLLPVLRGGSFWMRRKASLFHRATIFVRGALGLSQPEDNQTKVDPSLS